MLTSFVWFRALDATQQALRKTYQLDHRLLYHLHHGLIDHLDLLDHLHHGLFHKLHCLHMLDVLRLLDDLIANHVLLLVQLHGHSHSIGHAGLIPCAYGAHGCGTAYVPGRGLGTSGIHMLRAGGAREMAYSGKRSVHCFGFRLNDGPQTLAFVWTSPEIFFTLPQAEDFRSVTGTWM